MKIWELALPLDRDKKTPVFLQIARAIVEDIRRGRLRPKDPLPGSRTLASSLKVHRNTVLAAYQELSAEGWVETSSTRGTFVSSKLPEVRPKRFSARVEGGLSSRAGFDLRPALRIADRPTYPPGTLLLTGGVPDVRLVPRDALYRAYRQALRAQGDKLLSYGDPRGQERLRAELAKMLSATRGLAVGADDLLVTRGSQMAIYLVAAALLSPGEVVAVEALGYRPAWEALSQAGARLVPVPVDEGGLRVDALEALSARMPLRAVYLTPHHQYPSTATLTADRRLKLLALARERRIALLEDDYDHEFHYEGRPILPLASSDAYGVVIYLGTLSKILAPGLRLGYVVAPPPVLERLAAHRVLLDRQGDHAVEYAVALLLEEGEVLRHAGRARRVYAARRDAFQEALQKELGQALSFCAPPGGMAFWARVDEAIDVKAWAERALARGVAFRPGSFYAFDGRAIPYARLGFAAVNEQELTRAAKVLAAALP